MSGTGEKNETMIGDAKETGLAIYYYHDYRHFLRDWFGRLKSKKGLMVKDIAIQAKLSKSYLSMVLSGKRALTDTALRKVAPHLGLDRASRSFLKILVKLGETKDQETYLDLLRKAHRFEEYRRRNPLEIETFQYFTNWHYVAIRELTALPDFKNDEKWIQSRLRRPISPGEIRDAMKFLIQHGFIKTDNEGRIQRPDRKISTKPGVLRPALASFHHQMLEMASVSIFEEDSSVRNVTSYSVCIPQGRFEDFRDILNEARAKIIELSNSAEKVNSLYHFAFIAFPLSKEGEGETTNET